MIPGLPLYGGVLLTSVDVFIVLLFFNSYPAERANRSMHMFEIALCTLVMIVLASFVVLLVRVKPDWGDVFHGYIPGSGVINNGGLYIAVGIIGARFPSMRP